jgi:Ca2+:H+ antiporter
VFFSAAAAIVPIASLIVEATEQIALRTGDAVGGLLNATFGNAPELIIGAVALRAGLFDMVRASLAGAILANLLLGLGLAFFLGGLRKHDQEYNPGAARIYSSMMLIAVMSLGVPSAFARLLVNREEGMQEMHLNVGLAVLLLACYGLYLFFMLKTHPEKFQAGGDATAAAAAEAHGARWSVGRAAGTLVAASVLAAWMSEVLVGAAEPTGKALGMSDVFIGIVFLAIVGGVAESGSAIAMARKDRMDLSIGIALGSCIQIALFVAPALVLLSFAVAPAPMTLSFGRAEIGALLMAVLIGTVVAGDGRSNWYKGVQLITVYAIFAMLFYFMPEVAK